MWSCYKHIGSSITMLRVVVVIYASVTWFFFVLLPFPLATAGPTYCEVTHLNNNYCNYTVKEESYLSPRDPPRTTLCIS